MWALNNSLASASEQKRQSSRPAACMCSLFFPSRPSFCKYVFQLRGGGSGHRTQALEQESAICIQTQPWTCFSEPHFFACKMAVTGRLPLLGGSREVLHESACTLCGKEQQQPQFFPAHLSQRRVPAPIHHTGPNPELSLVLTLPHSHQTTHRRELRISPALSPPPPPGPHCGHLQCPACAVASQHMSSPPLWPASSWFPAKQQE